MFKKKKAENQTNELEQAVAKMNDPKSDSKTDTKTKVKKFSHNLISLVIAIIMFVALIMVEQSILQPRGSVVVVKAITNVPDGTFITAKNRSQYFKEEKVDGLFGFDLAVESLKDIKNVYIVGDLSKNEILASNRLKEKNSLLADLDDPVKVSLAVKSLDYAVGGVIRAGDLVNLGYVDKLDFSYHNVIENVYVDSVMDANGKVLDSTSKEGALMFTFILNREDEKRLDEAFTSNDMIISKPVKDYLNQKDKSNTDSSVEPSTEPSTEPSIDTNTESDTDETSTATDETTVDNQDTQNINEKESIEP